MKRKTTKTLKIERLFTPFRKHHALLFILLALSVTIFAVYSVNQILSLPVAAEYQAEAEANSLKTRFDRSTIDKITELRERTDTQDESLPTGRINPFN